MLHDFFAGFEKRAALSSEQRAQYEAELNEFNRREQPSVAKSILGTAGLGAGFTAVPGAIGGALGGAATGGIRGAGAGAIGGALTGAGAGAIIGALGASAARLYHSENMPKQVDRLDDKTLERAVKATRKYKAGDSKAMNRNYWQHMIDKSTNPKDKEVYRNMLAKEK